MLGHIDIGGQGGTPERTKIDINDLVFLGGV
jgi:hypothetical protein